MLVNKVGRPYTHTHMIRKLNLMDETLFFTKNCNYYLLDRTSNLNMIYLNEDGFVN